MNCKQCDTPLPQGVTFCPNCGARTQGSSSGMPTISFKPESETFSDAPTVSQASPAAQDSSFGLPAAPSAPSAPASQQFGLPTYEPPASQPSYSQPNYTQPGYTQPAGYGGAVQPSLPTSTAAIVSLVAGIVAWFLLPVISAIVAVVAGHIARREIRDSNGQLGGSGLATAGLILGYLQLGLTLLLGCLVVIAVVVLGAAAD